VKQTLLLEDGKVVYYEYVREKYGLHRWDLNVFENGEEIASAVDYNSHYDTAKEAVAEFLREMYGDGMNYLYHITYSCEDGAFENTVGCYTLHQAREIAQFIYTGYSKDNKVDYVKIFDGDDEIEELIG
jgi:hypothetical protein